MPKPSEDGIPAISTKTMVDTVAKSRFQPSLSIRIETMVSISEMEEVSAANSTRKKNRPPMNCPPGIDRKTFGRVMNIRPAPAPMADSSPPENTNTAGIIIRPARNAISVSKNSICRTDDSRLVSLGM